MEQTKARKNYFTTQLLHWHDNDNNRSLPWKSETDPYKIWLSEIILQQTRALQGLPYYLRFTTTYPTIKDLAAAPDEEVFRIWQGLGYYNRCKNMLATARYIAGELNGVFPATYNDIVNLKGIGPYTASAIASFAFGLPNAVVDGNVYRVLSRYFGIDTPIDSSEGKANFAELATELLPVAESARYNQAIMDLGATVCTPKSYLCNQCPLQKNCVAYHRHLIPLLPVKGKKITVSTRYFHYIIITSGTEMWVSKRTDNDIWQSLHEPLLIEAPEQLDKSGIVETDQFKALQLNNKAINYAGKGKQRLTHRIIESIFFTLECTEKPHMLPQNGSWVAVKDLKKLAFPKTVLSFLTINQYF